MEYHLNLYLYKVPFLQFDKTRKDSGDHFVQEI